MAAVPGIAWLLGDWFYIGLAVTLPRALFIFLLFFANIPESPRWLTSVGRVEEAKKIIQEVAKVNRKTDKLTEEQLDTALRNIVETQNKEPQESSLTGFWKLLSKPRLAKNSILLALVV
jgi:hypothetical protein